MASYLLRGSMLARASAVALRVAPAQRVRFLSAVSGSNNNLVDFDKLNPSLNDRFNFTHPTRWVPITVGGLVAANAAGLYHFNEESQLLGLFVLFVGTIYSQGGQAIGAMLDEAKESVLKEQAAIEEAQIEATKVILETHKNQVGAYDDIQSILAAQKDVVDDIVSTASRKLKHRVRDGIVAKLDTLVQIETQAAASINSKLLDGATAHVIKTYKSDTGDLYNAELSSALETLAHPDLAAGKDTVGPTFQAFFSGFRAKVEKDAGKEVAVSAEALAAAQEAMNSVAQTFQIEGDVKPDAKVVM